MATEFTPEIQEKLQHYVYRLIDPRNGETFYIGEGKGNRVFTHAKGDVETDANAEKMKRIRMIQLSGFSVAHVIHRHGMDKKTAFAVEAALIDAYPGLTNIMNGHGNSEHGVMHAEEIIKTYSAETAVFRHKAILISVNRSAAESDLYEATRFAWRLSKTRAEQADIVLPTVQGLIKGAFTVTSWLEATSENFPGKETMNGRYGFIGSESSLDDYREYIGKRVPKEYRERGAANPIKYTW